jgi:hypothetical protein
MIWVLERSPSLPRSLRTWLAAVCSEIESAAGGGGLLELLGVYPQGFFGAQ